MPNCSRTITARFLTTIGILLSFSLAARAFGAEPPELPQSVGHRGLLQSAPENTLAGFRGCLEMRVGFEFDVRRTKDGKLVCLHDDILDRTTDGKGSLRDISFGELRKLDAGKWFDPDFCGERVPTIEEIFALIAEYPNVGWVAVDLKETGSGIEEAVVKLAQKHKVLDRLVFIGLAIDSPEIRARIRAASKVAHSAHLALTPEKIHDALADANADWVYVRFIPPGEMVKRIHEEGKRIFLAGPLVAGNESGNWRAAAELRIDAILTDYPVELKKQLRLSRGDAAKAAVPVPGIADLWREPPVPVGLHKQLLTDDLVIAHRHNIHRDLNQATKANGGKPVLERDKVWEQPNLFQVQSVRREGDKFVMHYGYTGPVDFCCRAESENGLHWTKPTLGLREFPGSKENNLLDHQGALCFLDPHETDPAHKFKSVFRPLESSSHPHAACLASSSDGLHWQEYDQGKPVTGRAADTLSQLVWDERAKVYRLFTRTDFGAAGGATEVRGAREMINPDVKADPTNWTTVRNWIFDRDGPPEVKRRQIHTVNFWQHEGIDFGLMVVMEWPAYNIPQVEVGNDRRRHERDVWNCYLSTRRGGHACDWDLSWIYAEKPLIARGPDGAFDKDLIHNAASIVTWKDQHWIYYTGWPNGHMRHPYLPAIGLATLPLDRFIYLEPWKKSEAAWLITKPFKIDGNHLELNADASQGSIAVEILDDDGVPLSGFTQQGVRTA